MKKKKIEFVPKKPKGKKGPEKTSIDWSVADAILRCGCRTNALADAFKVCTKTIDRLFKEKYNMTVLEYRNQVLGGFEYTLIENMKTLAASNEEETSFKATKYLLENICGHSQKINVNQTSVSLSYEDYLVSLEKNP